MESCDVHLFFKGVGDVGNTGYLSSVNELILLRILCSKNLSTYTEVTTQTVMIMIIIITDMYKTEVSIKSY